jgi:hypothetical protein
VVGDRTGVGLLGLTEQSVASHRQAKHRTAERSVAPPSGASLSITPRSFASLRRAEQHKAEPKIFQTGVGGFELDRNRAQAETLLKLQKRFVGLIAGRRGL